jgi:hypothetical protein
MADLCCLNSGFTVCFPVQQTIPNVTTTQNNPYYDFSAQQSVWTYTINSGGTDINHVDIQVCSQLDKKDLTIQNSYDNGDNWNDISGFNIQGDTLRINESQGTHTSIIYRIVISGTFFNLAAETGTISLEIQSGSVTFDSTTCGISPNSPLLTPSSNCNTVNPPNRTRGIWPCHFENIIIFTLN